MSLEVAVTINGQPIISLAAVNRGHVNRGPVNEAPPNPDGWHNYEWAIDGVKQPDTFRHKRSTGAAFLAGTLLAVYQNKLRKETP